MNDLDFCVGDLVRIRDWDDLANEFYVDDDGDICVDDGMWFTSSMRYLCGREFIIEGFDRNFPDELIGNFDGYTVYTKMIELVDREDTVVEEDPAEFADEYMSVLLGATA